MWIRTVVSAIALCWLAILPAVASGQDDDFVPPVASEIEVAILGSNIVIEGKAFTLPCSLHEITDLLGPGDRVSKLHNWITTWDNFGLIAYCKPETTKVISVAICLAKKDYKFSPKKAFRGKLSVDGAEITAASRVREVNQAKKGVRLETKIPGLPASIQYPTVLITVGEEKEAGMDQVAISWREPNPKPPAPEK